MANFQLSVTGSGDFETIKKLAVEFVTALRKSGQEVSAGTLSTNASDQIATQQPDPAPPLPVDSSSLAAQPAKEVQDGANQEDGVV